MNVTQPTEAQPTEDQVREWIKEAVIAAEAQQATAAPTARPSAPGQVTGSSPARNQPCPCGSGRKYKKCCGAR